MKFYFLICIFSLFGTSLGAQINLSGHLKDSTNKALGYVTVSILSNDTVVNSTVADSLGYYWLKIKMPGAYIAEYSFVNYKTKSFQVKLSGDTIVNVVLSSQISELSQVTVTDRKPLIQRTPDKFILNVEKNISLGGKKTTDIMKQGPGVFVANNLLKMAGKDAVIVFINSNQVYLSGNELLNYLNSLPVELISSIEIIPTPPAKYDAQGNFGAINIVFKKNIIPGIRGNYTTDYMQTTYPGWDQSANIDYKTKKISLFALVSGYDMSSENITHSTYYYPQNSIETYNPREHTYGNLTGQFTADYDVPKNTVAGITYMGTFLDKSHIRDITNNVNFLNQNGNIDSSLSTLGVTGQSAVQNNISAYLSKKLDDRGENLRAEITWLQNNSNSNRPFSSTTTISNIDEATNMYMTSGFQRYNIYTAKVDFEKPLKVFTLAVGGKLTSINNTAGSNFYNSTANGYIADSTQSNTYIYKEKTQALYANLSRSLKKWSFQAGLRAETTETDGNSVAYDTVTKSTYLNLFPTCYVSFIQDDSHNFSLSYGRRIDKPQFSALDPFKWFINKYFYAEGNPYLQPSYTNTVELNYLLNNKLNFKLYYNHLRNGFGGIVILYPDSLNISKQTVENYLNKDVYGVNVYDYFNKIKWMDNVIQLDFDYQQYHSNNKAFTTVNGFSGTFAVYNTLYLDHDKKYQGVFNITDMPPGLYDYRFKSNSLSLDCGANFLFVKKKLTLSFYITDILKTSAPEYWYLVNNIKQVYRNYYDNRQIQLTLKYKFGNSYIKTLSDKTFGNDEEKSRIK